MYILALETTGPKASVALIDEENKVTEIVGDELLSHLKSLMPMTKRILEQQGVSFSDIIAVAASRGPGSFTGIRIGVSAARALSQVLSVPCISVPTLATFRYNTDKDMDKENLVICPVFDARRNQVYSGAFLVDEEIVPGNAYGLAELLDKLSHALRERVPAALKVMFFGDGIDKYQDQIAAWAKETNTDISFAPEELRYQRASSVARMASELYKNGLSLNYNQLKPDYMRLAEAERKLREKKSDE